MAKSCATGDHQKSCAETIDEHHEDHGPIVDLGWKALFSFTTKKHIPILCGALAFAFVAAITLPAMSILFGLLFRNMADFQARKESASVFLSRASTYCIYLTALCVINWISNSIYFALFVSFGELQAQSARNKVFDALLKKNVEWYDTKGGDMAAYLPTVQMHIRDLQSSNSIPLGEGVQCIVMGLGALGLAFYYAWNLTLVIICDTPIVYVVMSYLSRLLSKRAHEQADGLQHALRCATTAISNIETVKCYGGEKSESQKYIKAIAHAGNFYRRQAHLRSAQIGFMQFITMSIFFQGFWYGSYLVISGKKNAAQVVTTFWAASMAVQAITEFLPQFITIQKGKVASSRLCAIMATSTTDGSSSQAVGAKLSRISGDIEFKKVSFAYPSRPGQLALRETSLFFPAGDTTFIVGRSGSGKSTLGQLLVRFYNPKSGEITIDGKGIDMLDVKWLRENVTLVEQHSVLFDDTIRRNIELASKEQSVAHNEVEFAARFALLQQVIDALPLGLETLVGSKGNSLSGGQKQRVALARARLRDTPVLILDESTSALDYITRAAVLDAIRAWRKGKTTIIITHDISQIQPEDFVYIMDRAVVVQEGYRRDMETQKGSAFHTFLTNKDNKLDEERNTEDDEAGAYIEEVLSLYAASWAAQPAMPEDTRFSPFLSPWTSPGRSSLYRSSIYERQPPVPIGAYPSDLTAEVSAAQVPDEPRSRGESDPNSEIIEMTCALESGDRSSIGKPLLATLSSKRYSGRLPPRMRPLSTASYASKHTSVRYSRPASSIFIAHNALNARDVRRSPSSNEKSRRRFRRAKPHLATNDKISSDVPQLRVIQILKTFWPYLDWRSRMYLIVAIVCAIIHGAATPTFGFVFAQLLSTFYSAGNQRRLAMTYALLILSTAFVDGAASYTFHFLFDSCAQTWANNLKAEAMKRILMQPREFFDREENSLARLAECLDHFGEEARNLPGRFVGITAVVFVMLTVAIVWSLATCWTLTLVALATVPVLYCIMAIYNAVSSRWETFANEADANVGQVLHETFVNIRTVRCLALEDVFRKKFQTKAQAAVKVGFKRAIYTGSVYGINFSGVFFVSALCFWFGSILLSKGQFSTTTVNQTFAILLLSANHMSYIINYIPQINLARDAGSRLLRLARLPVDSHEQKGSIQLSTAKDISFSNLNFAYPLSIDHQVLHDVSFSIPQGSCSAIVGSSGSGKSTLAALLLKLYQGNDSTTPSLTICQHDIETLHTSALRSRMAIVSQTPVIFPGTVSENIAYGISPSSSRASPDSIRAAARVAAIDDFINSLPQGYDTILGDGGSGLSGGQAQRIAIARALVRDPDILILDEATSALDVESAGIVRDTIERLIMRSSRGEEGEYNSLRNEWQRDESKGKKKMTVVIITHAREMMEVAEHVVMLDRGKVIEQGGFEELKRRRGAFEALLRGKVLDVDQADRKDEFS